MMFRPLLKLLPFKRLFSGGYYQYATIQSSNFTLFRLFWAGGTAVAGYTGYKAIEAKNWFQEKLNQGNELISGLFKFLPEQKNSDGSDNNPMGKPPLIISAETNNESEENAKALTNSVNGNSNEYSQLIRKMIEVRDVLQAAGLQDKLENMPSIIVIGSQSSGKSSVLESLVGHQFLPKGHNMITRRPLELTLVHEPDAKQDFAVLAGGVKLYNFDQVKERIQELNEAVPKEEWISPEPIRLQVHSQNIPDLTLIDLPGYIQVSNKSQPLILKDKISQLCDNYITKNNIILAISAADVDLANSESIRASRRVDPSGRRTIGVITKLDLVEAELATRILRNETNDYPLKLGYIGMVCGPNSKKFKVQEEGGDNFGVDALQKRLVKTLERSMASNLSFVMNTVRDELKETKYQLKVNFNDHCTDEETFLRDFSASCKTRFTKVADGYPRERVRSIIRSSIEKILLDIFAQNFWINRDRHPSEEDIETAVNYLTRHGMGKMASLAILESLKQDLSHSFQEEQRNNPQTINRLKNEMDKQLHQPLASTIDQIENAIRPFKTNDEVLEWEVLEWKRAYHRAVKLLEKESQLCDKENHDLEARIGKKKLQAAARNGLQDKYIHPEATSSLESLVAIRNKAKMIKERLSKIKQSNCSVPDAVTHQSLMQRWFGSKPSPHEYDYEVLGEDKDDLLIRKDPCKCKCPEVFLYLIAERLISSATLYTHEELVKSLEYASGPALTRALPNANDLVKENSLVSRQIQLCKRLAALEKVKVLVAYLEQRHSIQSK